MWFQSPAWALTVILSLDLKETVKGKGQLEAKVWGAGEGVPGEGSTGVKCPAEGGGACMLSHSVVSASVQSHGL